MGRMGLTVNCSPFRATQSKTLFAKKSNSPLVIGSTEYRIDTITLQGAYLEQLVHNSMKPIHTRPEYNRLRLILTYLESGGDPNSKMVRDFVQEYEIDTNRFLAYVKEWGRDVTMEMLRQKKLLLIHRTGIDKTVES